VLIDTGDRMPSTREQLEAELAALDVELSDVDRILLTHWHGDHTGLAGEIQAESGASVHVHAADAPLVSGDRDAWEAMWQTQRELFAAWGMPEAKQEALFDRMSYSDLSGTHPDVTPFEGGDTFSVNGRELRVVHASGHAAGLCLFEFDQAERTEVFSGDALLPKYTPNVGGADVRVDRPLEKYIRALRAIAAADYDRAWPGHRDPIDDPTARAREIIHHHEERAWRVLDVLRQQGPCDPWTVSAALFGELHDIHVLHGPGEAYAHLEHLEQADAVERVGTEYRIPDATRDKLGTLDEQRWNLGV
jgi:glyoxylase-like metal-dependent hydrolase (beta-lactamase superfamily II)